MIRRKEVGRTERKKEGKKEGRKEGGRQIGGREIHLLTILIINKRIMGTKVEAVKS